MQVLTQKSTRATPAAVQGGVAVRRSAIGDVAGGADDGSGDDALSGLRQALDASPGVQTQLRLQRAMDASPRAALLAGAAERTTVQRADSDDDDEMTAAFDAATAQREVAAAEDPPPADMPPGPAPGNGLPSGLRAGIEQLSGLAMDDVQVHYNSAKPAQLQALAYAQGSDIHVGPGQEEHLPHEAWHVVQQKQGRVQPTLQLQGTSVNDDAGLEEEADRMGAQAASVTQRETGEPASRTASASGPVQAIVDVATFKGATPSAGPRKLKAIRRIDNALGKYIAAAGPNKLARLNTLNGAIATYLAGNHNAASVLYVQNTLQPQVTDELALINALGPANGGLVPDLIVSVGGNAHVQDLTAVALTLGLANATRLPGIVTAAGGGGNLQLLDLVAQAAGAGNIPLLEELITHAGAAHLAGLRAAMNQLQPGDVPLLRNLIPAAGGANLLGLANTINVITAPNAYMLLGLIPAAGGGGNLALLDALVTAITPANAYLLQGLIPAAGGGANLATLTQIVAAITPANAHELMTLVPLTGGPATLAGLLALVQAAGAGAAHALPNMVRDAGGAPQVVNLTNAINLHHAGMGLLAVELTRVTAGNAAEFQRLTTALPNFTRTPAPAAGPGVGVTGAVAAYNALTAAPGNPLPNNRLIVVQAHNMDHFLTRHTYEYFDFNNIDQLNDQWPFVGGGTVASVEAELANALNAFAANVGNPAWWILPGTPRNIVIGPYTVQVGVRTPQPPGVAPGTAANPLEVGRFFPFPPGGGVERFTEAAMKGLGKLT